MNRAVNSQTRQVGRRPKQQTEPTAGTTAKARPAKTPKAVSNGDLQADIADCDVPTQFTISLFSTALGWMGLVGADGELVSVIIGRPTANAVRTIATKSFALLEERDWNPTVRQMLEDYAEGEIVDFSKLDLRLPSMTRFRQKIIDVTRRLGYGETTSYGDLAQRAGHPRAARAVGTVMATNRFPILIPCHRVLASGGKLGGYTSPSGTDLKQRMLEIEARAIGAPKPIRRVPR